MRLSKSIKITLLALTIFNVLALSFNWYHTKPWVDIPAHFVFGVLIGLFLLSFHPKLKTLERFRLVVVLQIVFWGLAAGSFWEMMEYTRDTLYAIPKHKELAQQGTRDTIGDLANNIIGVGTVMFTYKFRGKKILQRLTKKKHD